MTRPPHPNKHIEAAIQLAQSQGWRLVKTGNSSHAWGRLLCLNYAEKDRAIWPLENRYSRSPSLCLG